MNIRLEIRTQSILKEISPEYLLEGLMVKLKLQYFGHLTQRTDSLEKTLMLGKIKGARRRGRQRMRWLDGITDLMDMSLSKIPGVGDGQGSLVCCSPWGHKSDITEQLNWTECFPQVALLVNILPANAGNTGYLGSIPGSGRSPRGGHGNPLQCSCLENPMDRGAWWATVHGSQRVGHDWATSLFTF